MTDKPRWNCVDFADGMHLLPGDHCLWCGKSKTDIEREREEMSNPDEVRRQMVESGQPHADLAADEGRRWSTTEMSAEFEVIGFAAPYVIVKRRSDGKTGTLEFTHSPRVYFGFKEITE